MKITIGRTGEPKEDIHINGYIFNTETNTIVLTDLHVAVNGIDFYPVEEDHEWYEKYTYRYNNYSQEPFDRTSISDSGINRADGITESLANRFFNRIREFYRLACQIDTAETKEIVYVIGGNEVWIEKPYAINGIRMSLKELSNKLSRIVQAFGNIQKRYKEEEYFSETKKTIRKIMKTPEDILYCLENRVPFYFFVDGRRENVRLNLKQIASSKYAIEVADGKWGEIKEKDLTTYLGHYLHNKNRGSWKFLSPSKLYQRVMGRLPLESELKVMIAFLLQNRTQDIVEKRAKQLIDDMAIQYKERILVIPSIEKQDTHEDIIEYSRDENGIRRSPMKVLVKGQKTDWLLVEKIDSYRRENDIQRVSTYCLLTERPNLGEEEDTPITNWNGPICINTGGKNPSLGDQFASRILSLMNDSSIALRVNTIGEYLINQKDRIRIPLKECFTNEKKQYKYDEMLGMSIQ